MRENRLPVGRELDRAIERLVFPDRAWYYSDEGIPYCPQFSTEPEAAILILLEWPHIVRLTHQENGSWSCIFERRVGGAYSAWQGAGETLAEAICRGALLAWREGS